MVFVKKGMEHFECFVSLTSYYELGFKNEQYCSAN